MSVLTLLERYEKLVAAQLEGKKNLWGKDQSVVNANLTSDVLGLILTDAVQVRTSDIHIEPTPDGIRIRFRVDGNLHEVLNISNSANITLISRIKILANMPVDQMSSRKAMDGRFSTVIGQQEYDFRTSTFPTILGEKLVLRILNKNVGVVNLKNIGMNPDDATRLERILLRKSGLLVVTGPTGSGKTTTLYSILHRLHTPRVNIVTLEDPVEYQVNGINQCDINSKGEETFASGLKAILRQDPNIVLIGEIRDAETADIAIRASITGHLVLTSLHANSALGTVIRLINMGLERYMVSYAVIGAMAQRLIPRLCEHCRTPYKPNLAALKNVCDQCHISPEIFVPSRKKTAEGEVSYVTEEEETSPEVVFYRSAGCDFCRGTGYKGRVGVFEVISFSDELRAAILRNAPFVELEGILAQSGVRTMAVDAIMKVKAGLISMEDAYPILLERST